MKREEKKEREDIEIHGQVTYTSEIFTFLFWEIEKQTYPERKITIRRRTDKKDENGLYFIRKKK